MFLLSGRCRLRHQNFRLMGASTVFGQTMVVVNDARVAIDMLDKHGAIYSDRPSIPMGGELVGWKNTLVLVPYGERHRTYRRLAHQLFGNSATMKAFHPVEEVETHRFLKRLLASPDAFSNHIRK
jgi:cytochrome P450